MPGIHIIRVAVTVSLKVPETVLEQRLVASPAVVGEELARQVQAYVRREHMGYYPPLDFFTDCEDAIEAELMDTVQGIAWFVTNLVRSEVLHRLRAAFSSVVVDDIRLHAFTMPTVRPSQPNSLHDLSRHYTPDMVKMALTVSSIERRPDAEGMDRLASHKVRRWLERDFEQVVVTSAQLA